MRPRDTGASRRFARWIPAIAAPIAIGAAVVLVPMQANAAVDLPDLTPEELLEFAASSDVEALSGTIEQTSELGLPDLSGLTGAMGGAGERRRTRASGARGVRRPTSTTSSSSRPASHTARVYLDGSNARLQVLDRLAERDVVRLRGRRLDLRLARAGGDARHRRPGRPRGAARPRPRRAADEARAQLEAELGAPLPTPDEVLDQALAKLDESTDVSVGTDARVAGREVYELVLEPQRRRHARRRGVGRDRRRERACRSRHPSPPVGAEEPAFSVAFTDVSFEAPDASVFAFTPARGHHGDRARGADADRRRARAVEGRGARPARDADGMPRPEVIGEGWSAVVVLPPGRVRPSAPRAPTGDGDGSATARMPPSGLDEASAMLDTLTQPVDGGRILSTSLVTVLFADDGRVLVGAVTRERLLDAAASGR